MEEPVKDNLPETPQEDLPNVPQDPAEQTIKEENKTDEENTERRKTASDHSLKRGFDMLIHPVKPLDKAWKDRVGMIVLCLLMMGLAFAPFAGQRVEFLSYGNSISFSLLDFWPVLLGFEILMALLILVVVWGEKHAVLITSLIPAIAILIGAIAVLFLFQSSLNWLPSSLQEMIAYMQGAGDIVVTSYFGWGFFGLLLCELGLIALAFLYYHHDPSESKEVF